MPTPLTRLWYELNMLGMFGLRPKVRGDHVGMLFDFIWCALGYLAAEIEHGDPMRNPRDQADVVLDQKHGHATRINLLDDLGERVCLMRIQAGAGSSSSRMRGCAAIARATSSSRCCP